MHGDPLGLWGYVSEETHYVGSVTGVIIPKCTISWRSFSIGSLYYIGTLQWACLEK